MSKEVDLNKRLKKGRKERKKQTYVYIYIFMS